MDDVALDIDTLFEKVKQQQRRKERTPARDGRFLTISRVREQTRNVRPDEYTPHYVPIGPYHWSQRRIDEKSKWLNIFIDAFSKRTGEDDKKVLLGKLLQEMKNLDASSCYSDGINGMGAENEFHMLLLDGCYLLACFADSLYRPNNNVTPEAPQEEEEPPPRTESATGAADEQQVESATGAAGEQQMESATGAAGEQQVESATGAASGVVAASVNDGKVRDILYLLENQIPFFVVQKIYELVTGESPPSAVLTMFAARVKNLLQKQLYIRETQPSESNPSHLLHLVRTYFPEPKVEGGASDSSGTGRWRRATEYCSYANVRFRPRTFDGGAVRSVLDVSLDVSLAGGALLVLVPLLRVDNNTWTILRNLMALEEHHAVGSVSPAFKVTAVGSLMRGPHDKGRGSQSHAVSLKRHVTAYCLFMSQLACTEEDVALLVRKRVVEHFLGSDAEVAAGFADLCKGVVLDVNDLNSNYLKPVWHKLERRYRSRWQNLVSLFRQTHVRNLLYAAAFVVAVILFASQVLQGIFTVMGYYLN